MDPYVYTGTGDEIDKDAAWDYIHQGYLLSPRTVLKGRTKLPQPILPVISIDSNKPSFGLQDSLLESMGDIRGIRRGVMFSGGFDSILIAMLAKQGGAQITAVTIQFDDFNPLTVEASIQAAAQAGFSHHILHVKAVEFLSAFEVLAGLTDEPLLDLDLAIVYAALKKYDPATAGDVFLSGMGSDQWFGDEALGLNSDGIAASLDWAMMDETAHHRVAQAHGLKFVFPFLSSPMLALSQAIPPAMKRDKKILRELTVADEIASQGTKREIQVPLLVRNILIKTYGHRAWPGPVYFKNTRSRVDEQILRQIALGLWLEKVKFH